ncbi:MAG: DMT family transporter [Bdellovibrionales bacterium]|nr:DMT family transporter [Bdellovibrionales bacterium]
MLGPLLALLSSVTWTIGSAYYGQLSLHRSPFAVNFGRALISLPLFVLVALLTSPEALHQITWHHIGWSTASVVSSYALGDVFFMLSIKSLGLPGALAIGSSYPLWSSLASWLVNGEPMTHTKIFGIVAVVGGTIFVILSQPNREKRSGAASLSNPIIGIGLGLVTSLFWAANAFSVSKVGTDISAFWGNAIRMAVALVLCPFFGTIFLGPKKVFLSWLDLRRGLPFFVTESFLGAFFFMYGLTHAPLAIAATLSSLAPVLSVPVALAMGWEKPSFLRVAGVCAVVAGVSLLVQPA